MTSVDVLDPAGKKSGSVDLPAEVFDVQVNVPLIHQVVVAQLAAARQDISAKVNIQKIYNISGDFCSISTKNSKQFANFLIF